MIKKIFFLISISIIASPTYAAIFENNSSIKFTVVKNDNKNNEGDALRLIEFKKFKQTNNDEFIKNNATLYTLEGNKNYISLIPFIEWLQFSDFQVSPNKNYAVVYSASCQKKVASAEAPWKCQSHASTLNSEGYIQGDIKGDFNKILFHKTAPYVFLIRDACGDSAVFAEVYDLKGKKIRTIKSFTESMLENTT